MANTTNTTSYLDPPSLIGRQNNDGTISLTPLELKRLNDFAQRPETAKAYVFDWRQAGFARQDECGWSLSLTLTRISYTIYR